MTARWDVERALRGSGLPAAARHVALELLTRAEAGTAEVPAEHSPSLSGLARDTGMSRRAVMRALNVLESGGWITRLRDLKRAVTEGQPTRYRLHAPAGAGDAALGQEVPQSARAGVALGPEVPQSARAGGAPDLGSQDHIARAPVAHISDLDQVRPLSPRARGREIRAALAKLDGTDEREIDLIIAGIYDDPRIKRPAAYLRRCIDSDGGAELIADARHANPRVILTRHGFGDEETGSVLAEMAAAGVGDPARSLREKFEEDEASAKLLLDRARRKLAAQDADDDPWPSAPPPARPPWCGQCDERTRWRETPEDHLPYPCPECHHYPDRNPPAQEGPAHANQ